MIANLKGGRYIWRNSVDVASIGSSLSVSALVGSVLDGYTITATSRVLVKDQATTTQNGVYVNNNTSFEYDNGTRSTPHGIYYVINGTINGGKFFVCDSSGYIFSLTFSATVSSVGLSAPSIFSVSGSPITSAGTLAITLASESANSIFAAPNGSSGTPSFRSLVAADLPIFTGSTVIFANSSGILSADTSLNWIDSYANLAISRFGNNFANLSIGGTTQHAGIIPSGGFAFYSTGTASSSGLVVTGVGTSFVAAMVGGVIYSVSTKNTTAYTITSYSSATSITVSSAPAWSAVSIAVIYSGSCVDAFGNTTLNGSTYLQGTLLDSTNSAGNSGEILTTNGVVAKWASISTAVGNQTANLVFASPNGSTGAPSFRSLVAADLPTFTSNSIIFAGSSGILSTGNLLWNGNVVSVGGSVFCSGFANALSSYSTGTVSASSSTILGLGTTFTASMIGGLFICGSFASIIQSYVNASRIVVSASASFTGATFIIYYGGAQGDGVNFAVQNLNLTGELYANGSAGSTGAILSSTGTTTSWQSFSANSIIYSNGSGLTQDNANFTWSDGALSQNVGGTIFSKYYSSSPSSLTVFFVASVGTTMTGPFGTNFTSVLIGGLLTSGNYASQVISVLNSTQLVVKTAPVSAFGSATIVIYYGGTQIGDAGIGVQNMTVSGTLLDSSNSPGSSGYFLTSTGSGIQWQLSSTAGQYIYTSASALTCGAGTTSILFGTNYSLYGAGDGVGTQSTIPSVFSLSSSSGGYGILYTGPSNVLALISFSSDSLTLSSAVGTLIISAATSNTASFNDQNYVIYAPFTSTTFSVQRFGYILLKNNYKYAPCCYTGSSVTITVAANSRFSIQIL